MSVGICGVGFVGDALLHSFKQKEINCVTYDKFKEEHPGPFSSFLGCDFVFVCVPTLFNEALQEFDKSAIKETCAKLAEIEFSGAVVLKSTVEPGTAQALASEFPSLRLVHNPEFLTARSARQDFHHQSHIIIGPASQSAAELAQKLRVFYQNLYPSAAVSVCESSTVSECAKLMANSFYAAKVQLCNEFYLMCQQLGISYADAMTLVIRNGWISTMHTQVPGPDGKLSYGGACFPKDTSAMASLMKRLDSRHAVLDAVIREQKEMRTDND